MIRLRRGAFFLFAFLVACRPAITQAGFEVHYHPDGGLYVGDLVSFEVLPPPDFDTANKEVVIRWNDLELGRSSFGLFGVGQRSQATFWWLWDTHALEPDVYSLTFTILPDDLTWEETIVLADQNRVPPPEPEAHWAVATTDCCTLHYITGTSAERDLEILKELVETQVAEVERRVSVDFEEILHVTFLPRVMGHGGFTSQGVYLSYLDSQYAGGNTEHVMMHEMIHALDFQVGGDFQPPFFLEGVAVYISGGHYKPEPLLPRAAVLLDVGLYIPLPTLIEEFYFHQHEIGYLEAGALVAYMIQVYGWEDFDAFYRDIHPHPSGQVTQAIGAALQIHFGITLEELETNFLAFLETQDTTLEMHEDLHVSILLYDSIRRYQQIFDPSAYYLTLWVPDPLLMRERGILADLLRHPSGYTNRTFEHLLMKADQYIQAGQYLFAEKVLNWINFLLDRIAY